MKLSECDLRSLLVKGALLLPNDHRPSSSEQDNVNGPEDQARSFEFQTVART